MFKRDGFQCQYCGQTPPTVVLEVDHVLAVANGGKSAIDNLLTACFDCNRGKAAEMLNVCPQSLHDKSEILREKQEQLRAFERLKKSIRRWEESKIDEVESAFQEFYPELFFLPKFRTSVRIFIQRMDSDAVVDAMHRACARIHNDTDALKYFCGICWKTIKQAPGERI